MSLTCPKCNKKMKSKSGWTLHVKKCCPDQRWRKTTVKMEIEFEIPKPIGEAVPAVHMFQTAFHTAEIKGIGTCRLNSAMVLDRNISTRKPTLIENHRMSYTAGMRDKNTAIREFKRLLKLIVGGPQEFETYTEANYPKSITISYHGHDPGLSAYYKSRYWRKQYWKLKFELDIQKSVISISTEKSKHKRSTTKKFQLADPDCFDEIREFTGMAPPGD
jgi:hypothetical protein